MLCKILTQDHFGDPEASRAPIEYPVPLLQSEENRFESMFGGGYKDCRAFYSSFRDQLANLFACWLYPTSASTKNCHLSRITTSSIRSNRCIPQLTILRADCINVCCINITGKGRSLRCRSAFWYVSP